MELGKAAEMLLSSIPHGKAIDIDELSEAYEKATPSPEIDEAFETLWEFKGTFPKKPKSPLQTWTAMGARVNTPNPAQKAALDAAWEKHKAKIKTKTKTKTETSEFPESLTTGLASLDGIIIKVCGSWLWLHGSTDQHKTALKSLGCKFGKKKQLWYWSPPGSNSKRRKKGGMPYEWITSKYGEKDL